MTYEPPDYLWPPQKRGMMESAEKALAGTSVCLYAPTGGGKGTVAVELMRMAQQMGVGGLLLLNRRLLVDQMSKRLDSLEVSHGVRASGYKDKLHLGRAVQVSSMQTELSRVYKTEEWGLHDAGIVVVDELHLQTGEKYRQVIDEYKERGAAVIGMSATPVACDQVVDELVVSGTMQEYRDCKAIVMATTYSPIIPDMSKVKRTEIGEYMWKGKMRKEYVQHVVGHAIENYCLHSKGLPTKLYAPGVAESIWFTDQFMAAGIRWAHMDARDAILDGKRYTLTRSLRQDILGMLQDGKIKGISNRFLLREGIDVPEVGLCLLCTPIGSFKSFIQTVGRALRYSEKTPEEVTIVDCGGNYRRFGSPNADRDWYAYFAMNERQASRKYEDDIKEGKIKESIVCPECSAERMMGSECPHCGFSHKRGRREVIMEDGTLEKVDGPMTKVRKVKDTPRGHKLWNGAYWGNRKKGGNRTFRQLRGFIAKETGIWLRKDLPLMPRHEDDWSKKVCEVPVSDLYRPEDLYLD